MAKADDEGIPLEDYIKLRSPSRSCAPSSTAGIALHLGRCRRQRPCERRWWLAAAEKLVADGGMTTIDRERHLVRGWPSWNRPSPICISSRCTPRPLAVEHPAQEAPRRGRPSSASLVLKEAERRLRGSDRARHIPRGRKYFLVELSDWLRDKHPETWSMAAKTIGDRLRENAKVQALLPKSWLRRK